MAPGDIEDHPEAVSPGQWTADIRRGYYGNDWDHTNWRHYRRLETAYGPKIRKLMAADADEEATQRWAGGPGWAGPLRALFITMRPEQDERPGSPDHTPWRLRWMKEKFGALDIRTTGQTPYQSGAVWFIEDNHAVHLHQMRTTRDEAERAVDSAPSATRAGPGPVRRTVPRTNGAGPNSPAGSRSRAAFAGCGSGGKGRPRGSDER